jgi:2',3'-cyclic-nucleotide 2'-phosphodiesterase (5'-nucleotidase family)
MHGHVEPWVGWEGSLAGRPVGGFDRLAAAIRRVRSEVGETNVLLIDAGDAIADTMVASETQGQAVYELLERLGYDAMALGNHEPDFGSNRVEKLSAEGKIPILAANVTLQATGDPFCRPYLVKRVGPVKVGILGLAYPNRSLTTAPKNVAGLTYRRDSAAVVREHIPKMRDEGAEAIIVLSHLGLGADLELAEQVPGIDVIVGGHSHNRMTQPTRVRDAAVVQAGAHCSDLGRLDLVVENGRLREVRRELIPLDHATVPSEPDMAEAMRNVLDPFRPKLDEVIATAAGPIVRAQTMAGQQRRKRDAESPADSLFCDILREETGCEIVMLPGVGYGVAIPAGPITASALRNLLPHDSGVVTCTMTGRQVRNTLEQAVTNTFSEDPRTKVGGMIQISGLQFTYDPARSPAVRQVKVGEEPLDDDRHYAVVTNSMMAQGGHNYREFLQAQDRRERGRQYEIIANRMRAQGTVSVPPLGRIRKVDASNGQPSRGGD